VGLKLVAYGVTPVFVRQTLTASTLPQELDAVHPVFARQAGLVTYHWGTPGFLDLCEVLGLDPQAVRPRFRPGWEELAEELLRWSCTVAHGMGGSCQSPQGEMRAAVSDLLAMMRVEARPTLRQLDALRERWEMMDRNGIPRFGELDALVNSDALLDPAADPETAGHRNPPLAGLDMLPSRYGPGCQTSIKGYHGRTPPAGWPDPDDAELRGIAIALDGGAMWERPWLRDAMQGLRGQGMVFLSPAETWAYLESDEAAYWVWRWGGTPCWRQVRWPALWKRLLWRVWPPALPRDRELAARRGAEPHDRPNGPFDGL